jgi:putative ABC transport system permease protein
MLIWQSWRSWRGAKGVALLAAAALAAGIGSVTAIYTVVNAVMLRPLPYGSGDRFVALFSAVTTDLEHYGSLTVGDARLYQDRATSFDAFGWFRESSKNLTFAGEPHHVIGVAVTPALVRQLGAEPALGQWFRDDRGVVISNGLWRELGSPPDIIGQALTLDGRQFTVTGVMRGNFRLPVNGITSDFWIALDVNENAGAAYFAYARRRAGVTFAAADADVKRVAAQMAADDPVGHPAYTARLFDLRETAIKDVRPTLLLLFAAAGLLFLITCANAAGVLLARSVARARDTAIRVAVGARRGQLAALFFGESLPVAIVGALGGVLISVTMTPVIVSLASEYLPRTEEISVDWKVLLFLFGAALAASAVSSLAPLWQALRTAPHEALGGGARASAGARSRRLSQWLVTAEITLAFSLLATSAALIIHLRTLAGTSPGFDPDNLLTFGFSVPGNHKERVQFQQRVADALRSSPGVVDVAFTSQLPLDGCCMGTRVYADGREPSFSDSQRTSLSAVSPGFFRVMRIPLRRGRLLADSDLNDKLIYVVVNESAAQRFWGGQEAVGAHGRFASPDGAPFEIVGVVGDVKNDGLGNPVVPEFYIHSRIREEETVYFVTRSTGSPAAMVPEVRRAIRGLNPEQPIHDITTMRDIVSQSMTLERAGAVLASFFAAAALLLASLGVYGVMAYSVRQRTAEIGTRMAVGATPRDIVRLILGAGARMAAFGVTAGVLIGVVGLAVLGKVVAGATVGPGPFLYAATMVGIVALVASAWPAWRASLLSPMVAIRQESASLLREARTRVGRSVQALSHATTSAMAPTGAFIAEFVGSLRQVRALSDATTAALTALQRRVGAVAVTLLQKVGNDYRGESIVIPGDGCLVNRLRHYPHPLTVTPEDLDAWARWARDFKPQHVAEIARLQEHGVRVAVPLHAKTEIIGVLLVGAPADRERYTSEELDVLSSTSDVFALMLENARLTERTLEEEKLRRDLALAAEVQRRLLPPQPPHSSSITLTAFTLPARSVGGDYYDFLDLGGGGIGVAIADVSGKGIAAALVMSVVQASLRVISQDPGLSVSALAARMNGFLHRSTGANKYATFFYARIAADGRQAHYVNAGHNRPYLVRRTPAGVEMHELDVGGTVLGLFPEVSYDEAVIDLHPGDVIIAFTDGVTDALNAQGEEFGEERLRELLSGTAGDSAPAIASQLGERVREWMGGAEQYDDLTFVVVAMHPSHSVEKA